MLKQELRKQILELIKHQKEEDGLYKSRIIWDKVTALPVFHKAKTILSYASFRGEVDTFCAITKIIEVGKKLVLPVVQKERKQIIPVSVSCLNDLKLGAYGILEPYLKDENIVSIDQIDCVIVPGIAFDSCGNRLGRGAGFYDRFLSELPVAIPTIGLAFDFQIVEEIPDLQPYDHPVSIVITN